MPSESYIDVIAFASDFSGADPTIVKRVQEMVVNPPTDMETVGFYGAEDSRRHSHRESPRSRQQDPRWPSTPAIVRGCSLSGPQ